MIEQKNSYKHEELLECAKGNMFGEGNAQLPNTGMLMFDTISKISSSGGEYDKGYIDASLEIKPDLWFFDCHFINDPVMQRHQEGDFRKDKHHPGISEYL